jgi:signal transduction histidine kinase
MFGDRTIAPAPPVGRQGAEPGADRPYAGVPEVGPLFCEDALATVAHELRGPLATILSALEAMTDRDEADPAMRRACEAVGRQALRAVRIVDDLFDVCAGSLGKLSLNKEVVEVAGVVAGALEAAGHLLAGHELTVSLPPRPLFVLADPLRVEQVLTNLLANAAKFTDPGGHIRLAAEEDAGHAVFRVRDDGRGIPPNLLPRVFDLFAQGADAGARAAGGLGLGLALVKSLVELHGGRVAACSDGPGRGAEFVVRLPACDPNA